MRDFIDDGPQQFVFDVRSELLPKNGQQKETKPFQIYVRNDDDDYASFVVEQLGSVTAEDGSQAASFTVRITAQPVGVLRVPIKSRSENEGMPDRPEIV